MPKYYPPANFRVEIGGMPAGYFIEVSGLGSEHETLPGPTKWNTITLKKGYVSSDPLGHKINPASLAHKINPASPAHKINPASLAHKINPASPAHKINPASAAHKVNPSPATSMKANAQIVLHGFVVDDRCQHLLQHWVNPATPKKSTPRGVIVMLDEAGRPVTRWHFENAWPSKVSGPSPAGEGASVALTISRLTRG